MVLFLEGTTSNGQQILPFRSSLLEPGCEAGFPLTAACIEYALADGTVESEVCYWADMTFFPHLLRLITKQQVAVRVRFAKNLRNAANRKDLARQLHAEVVRLKTVAPRMNTKTRDRVCNFDFERAGHFR